MKDCENKRDSQISIKLKDAQGFKHEKSGLISLAQWKSILSVLHGGGKLQINTTPEEMEAANYLLAQALNSLDGSQKLKESMGINEEQMAAAHSFKKKLLTALTQGA